MAFEIKTIGASGQISLGKQYAGRTVTVEQVEDGVWLIKSARLSLIRSPGFMHPMLLKSWIEPFNGEPPAPV
jgi:hypothetical protein